MLKSFIRILTDYECLKHLQHTCPYDPGRVTVQVLIESRADVDVTIRDPHALSICSRHFSQQWSLRRL